jgi:hypothetical protein
VKRRDAIRTVKDIILLDESFQEQLHSSVRGDFIECLEEKRREDEYEARQDEKIRERTRRHGPTNPSG